MQDFQQVLWAKAEGIEQPTGLDLLKRTWKVPIWSEGDDEEMTLPDPEIPPGYSLHHAEQNRQDWEDELPPETMGRKKKQEKGKSHLHAEEHFAEELESVNLDPHLGKLFQKYREVFGALLAPLSCEKLVQIDLKLRPNFEGSVVRRRPLLASQNQIDARSKNV